MPGLRLRGLFDPNLKAARLRALHYVGDCNPTWTVTNARLRATEPTRYVFAVFYHDPEVQVLPGPYILIAISRDGDSVEILGTSPESPYWIRGRK